MILPFRELEPLLARYNDIMEETQSKAIFVRGIELQEHQIIIVDKLLAELDAAKDYAVTEQNERKANFLRCLYYASEAVKLELQMIVNLKKDNANAAWNCLVNAQGLIGTSMRNNPFGGDYLEGFSKRLHMYEVLLFPKLQFVSSGGFIVRSECSICGEPYGMCDHIKGKLYMGKMCQQLIHEIDLEEVSFVDNPADKTCRVISFSDGGKNYDVFTHREEITNDND